LQLFVRKSKDFIFMKRFSRFFRF